MRFSERVHSPRSRIPKKAKTTICKLVLNLRSQFFQSRLCSFPTRKNCALPPTASAIPQNGAIRFVWQSLPPHPSTPVPTKQMPYLCNHRQQGFFVPRQDYPCHVPMLEAAFPIRNIRRRYRKGMRQTLRVNRYMPLDTAHFLVGIVAFFHGGIRVLHTLRINNQESGCFMASLLAALRNHLIF
ncbi:Uncharacterised protein [Cardiobacterium valvarum]|uniref:Uncharacterized protein n=1 Tax=Cardiobacterium valvarum TaxID=194702 RepID=A0A381ECN0_9GAMM|nr:Uncharacterised protein [Cardiobacterium valvarum]